MLDQSKVKPYYARALLPPSDTLPLSCNTFLLLCPLVTVYFPNDVVTDCFFRDKSKNRFSISSGSFYLSIYIFFECLLSLGAAT
jgi:hypothetical protein